MTTLFINIKELLQVRDTPTGVLRGDAMKTLPSLKNAFLLIEDETIVDFGEMKTIDIAHVDEIVDCTDQFILPAWCDSHTHLVYAGNREQEFVDRINGLTYEEIANRGGGILNSAKKLQETSEDELYSQSEQRLKEVMKLGTGAIEIKSGYGLTTAAELKMLKVIRRLKKNYPIAVKATFLGAHAVPAEYKLNKAAYLKLVMEEMLPLVAAEKLADYVDIFCESGYFSVADTEELLYAAKKLGLPAKIHVNQFNAIGGVQAGVQFNAVSVDHLEVMRDEDYSVLMGSETIPVALPSCSFFLSIPYTPAREIIDRGLPLALATDYNPGSTPSGNMNFVVATACIKMKMTPEEAINAATINGACAMGLSESHGSISIGKSASIIVTKKIPSYNVLPYAFGSNLIDSVYVSGIKIK